MESEIISSENVKPSSPTHQNLRNYKFSMLDQMFPPMLLPILLYFPNTMKIDDLDVFIAQTTQQLKRSLSVILTRFYPLAGRLNSDGQSIDCDDEGIPFVVAKFKGQKLSDLLRNPDLDLPRHLLPCETKSASIDHVVLIQVSYFDCGGVAVGGLFRHRAVDAITVATFLQSWASTTRGSKQPVCPNYIAPSMFPQKQGTPKLIGSVARYVVKTGKPFTRRYVFDASAISSLKSKSKGGATRVEAVSALLWKCFMAASLAHDIPTSAVTHSVNLRRRAEPPFPSECFGNFAAYATATSCNENDKELGELVRKVRDAVNKIDDDFVSRMLGDEGLSGCRENLRVMWSGIGEGVDVLFISSCCGFDLYSGTDFGWGKPIWLNLSHSRNDTESPFTNMVWLIDTRNGDGIEAWVILDEKYMSVFDNVEELRAVASIDPSPLEI